jgi:hypothetical protein
MTYHPEVLKRGGLESCASCAQLADGRPAALRAKRPPSWASTSSGRLLRPPTGTLQTRPFDWRPYNRAEHNS